MEPLPTISPQIPHSTHQPKPSSPWVLSQQVFGRAQSGLDKGGYKTCEMNSQDPEWAFITAYFQAHKPTNRSIKKVHCIHNPDSTRQFQALIPSLEK
ncbi:MAG: hypothetical protein ACXVAJ_08235, partial [Parachlamydiaceae bacterium]